MRQASPYIGIGHGSPVLHPEHTKASLSMQKIESTKGQRKVFILGFSFAHHRPTRIMFLLENLSVK